MSRIGFIGLNELSESIVMAIYRTLPETQVFLYPSECSHVQKLASVYPCWTLDNCQAVSEESEIIILSASYCHLDSIQKSLNLRDTHTLVSLIPDVSVQQLRLSFRHAECVRMTIINQQENSKPLVVVTEHNQRLSHFLSQTGLCSITTSEKRFNLFIN